MIELFYVYANVAGGREEYRRNMRERKKKYISYVRGVLINSAPLFFLSLFVHHHRQKGGGQKNHMQIFTFERRGAKGVVDSSVQCVCVSCL